MGQADREDMFGNTVCPLLLFAFLCELFYEAVKIY